MIATSTTLLPAGWVVKWLRSDRMFCGRVPARGEVVDSDDWASLTENQRSALVKGRFVAIVAAP